MQGHLFFAFLLAAFLPMQGSDPMFHDPQASQNSSSPQPSERERDGLRGPVRSVEEETTYLAQKLDDGSQSSERKSWKITEYDRDGRIVAIRSRGPSPGAEWVRRSAYSPAGLLLSVTFGEEGKAANEMVYRYDDQGRLQSITDSGRPGHPVVFRYDADGKKTRIATVPPAAYPPGTAVGISSEALFAAPELAPLLPEGGPAITLYDEQDRPTEVQLYDPAGTLVRRFVRVYDDRGNVVDERQISEDLLGIIPAQQQSDIFAETGASAQDLRAELTKFLGSSGELYSSHYEYDQEGRKTLAMHTVLNHTAERTETSYNDHGDVAKEIAQSSPIGSGHEQPASAHSSEVVYSYEYDSKGNWTVKKTTSRTLPDGQPRALTEVRRAIEYY